METYTGLSLTETEKVVFKTKLVKFFKAHLSNLVDPNDVGVNGLYNKINVAAGLEVIESVDFVFTRDNTNDIPMELILRDYNDYFIRVNINNPYIQLILNDYKVFGTELLVERLFPIIRQRKIEQFQHNYGFILGCVNHLGLLQKPDRWVPYNLGLNHQNLNIAWYVFSKYFEARFSKDENDPFSLYFRRELTSVVEDFVSKGKLTPKMQMQYYDLVEKDIKSDNKVYDWLVEKILVFQTLSDNLNEVQICFHIIKLYEELRIKLSELNKSQN